MVFNHLGPSLALVAGATAGGISIWTIIDHLGHNSVILFFCLSGFVLQKAYQKATDHGYFRYLVKRIFRLFPAFLVVLAGVVVAMLMLRPSGEALINNGLDTDISPKVLLNHILLIGVSRIDVGLVPPMWSLVYEWRFSLLFPFAAPLCMKAPRLFMVAALALYGIALALCATKGLGWPYLYGFGRIGSIYVTMVFLPVFALGMVLATISRGTFRLSLATEIALVLIALCVFGLVHEQMIVGFAAIALIVAVMSGTGARRLLQSRIVEWLGRISYPLYLCHVPVLYFTMYLLASRLGVLPAVAIGFVISFGLAHCIHVWVEKPWNERGRRIAAFLGDSRMTTKTAHRFSLRCLFGLHAWDHNDRIMWELHEGKTGFIGTPCKRCPAKLPPQTADYL